MWQPIETADLESLGHVLVTDGDYVTLGWYDDERAMWMDPLDCNWEDPFTSQPTHWMPLPEPP